MEDNVQTQEELKQTAAGFGAYLATLLFYADVAEEQKEAWAALVPEMSFEQMDRLAALLRPQVDLSRLPEFATERVEFERIESAHQSRLKALVAKAQVDLSAIMDEVNAAENS